MARNAIALDDASNYFDGVESEVWLYNVNLTKAVPKIATVTFTVGAVAGALNATTLSTLALPRAIPKGQRFITGNSCFLVTEAALAGATSIKVSPLKSTIAASTVITYLPMVPFYSVADATFKADGETITFRNFGAAPWALQAKTLLSGSFSLSGFVTKNDPGLPLIRNGLYLQDNWVYIQYIPPDDQAFGFYAYVKSGDNGTKVDEGYMNSFELVVSDVPDQLNMVVR
jgi:hypothetical protein